MNTEKDKLVTYWNEQGYNFYESSKILLKKRNQHTIYPIITLQAFSIECLLKALLTLTNSKTPRIHFLNELFNELPSDVKDQISNEFFTTHHQHIDQCLIQISKSFIDSRYFMSESSFIDSGRGQAFYPDALEIISEFLYNFIKCNGETIKYNYK